MSIYRIFNDQGVEINTIIADEAFVEENYPGKYEYVGEIPVKPKPWDSLIGIDAFMDRFGAAKAPVMNSTNTEVKSIIDGLMSKSWVNLSLSSLESSIDTIMSIETSLTPAIKINILATPVSAADNAILRAMYFPGQ